MSPKIELVRKEIGDVLKIEESASMFKLPSLMGKDLNLILEYLKEQDVKTNEPPYARYLDIDWDAQMKKGMLSDLFDAFTKKWHFFVGFSIPKSVESRGNIIHELIEQRKYIQTTHFGPYHKVGDTYKRLYEWAKNENLDLEHQSIEFYLNDPKETEKKDLETLVLIPVR